VTLLSATPPLVSPFPGLRPFKSYEDAIFFGRHEQVSDMLQRLETCRLLTVVGASGCGKSSLVRAGLLPALHEGLLFGNGSEWKMITLRPGCNPYPELAGALSEALPVPRPSDPDEWRSHIQAMLLSGDSGLIRVVNEAGLPLGSNVLVLVDQFEELFRFRSIGCSEDKETAEKQHAAYEERNTANAFVNLLLETINRQTDSEGISGWRRFGGMTSGLTPKHPIFVVLTMRSEFLGHCDAFLGLPEAVSQSQFLTPRMTREQLKDAIVRPLQLFGAVADTALVNRILNDVGTDPDSLPLMQHALLRTWQNAKERLEKQPLESRQKVELKIADYEKAGGLQKALSLHADEAYAELGGDPVQGESYRQIAQRLFLLLCRQTGEGVMVRNPIQVAKAAESAGVSTESIAHVAMVFSKEGRNFITFSSDDQHLTTDSTLDISHESLIRNWDTFKAWIKTEMKSVADYAWLLKAAEHWKAGGELFSGPNLRIALAWKEQARPSADWAARYGGDFDLAMRFLEESKKRRRYRLISGAALAGFVVLALFLYGLQCVSLLKANEQLREIGDAARRQSQDLFARAEALLKDKNNPRALAQLSRSLDRDTHNVAAAERACTLLLNQTWCPPLTPPLRYSSESPILNATFHPEGDGNRVLAVSQDGWLLRSDDQGKALVPTERLTQEVDGKNTRLISASFSGDGRALAFMWPVSNGLKRVEFCRYANGKYQPVTTVEINDYSVYNSINWSADDNLLTITPLRWDGTGLCRAYYFDGTSYLGLEKPFGDSQVVAVAFAPDANLAATASTIGSTGSLQLWEWQGGSFKQLPDTSAAHSRYDLRDRHIRSLVFGKTKEELFVVTFAPSTDVQVQRVNLPMNLCENLGFGTQKDQILRLVAGPSTGGRCLIATSLYQRISIDYSDDWSFAGTLAEPICFQGTTGISMFNLSGSKLMTLSGSIWSAPDTVQIWDVSMRIKGEAIGEFHADGKPAPPWLAKLARAVSGIPRTWDSEDDAAVLPNVFEQAAPSAPNTLYPPYDRVWRHFFPAHELVNERGAEQASAALISR
jgi:WD40 repeat protein